MILLTITWVVFVLIGLALAGGGGYLVALGGSPYYVIAGLGFLLTAVLLAMRRPLALIVYGLVILLSLG